jgi:hypothetical protein
VVRRITSEILLTDHPMESLIMRNNNDKKSKMKVMFLSRGEKSVNALSNKLEYYGRFLSSESERDLVSAIGEFADVIYCCDWTSRVNLPTFENIVTLMQDVDACIGIHGAGLANCFFGPPGMVIFEIQVPKLTYFGYDYFMKLAHSVDGSHAVLITRNVNENGVILSDANIADISELLQNMTMFKSHGSNVLSYKFIGRFTGKRETKFITVSESNTQRDSTYQLGQWGALDLLGPKAVTDTNGSSNPNLQISSMNYSKYCRTLPYFEWRKFARKIAKRSRKVTCRF